jgi:thioredoxin reductase (NADPH)
VTDVRDVIIIGSGPAGYTAALYAARARLRPLLFEGSVTAGGALMNTTDVENFPGFSDGIIGPDLMDQLRKQAERFGAELVPDDVTAVDLTVTPKVVRVGEHTYQARTVIIATGSGYRELGVPGEKRLAGHGVSWCATCDGFFFRDTDIAVVGGGDSAMEEALFLTRFATKVTLLHRREQFRASKIMLDRAMAHPQIAFRPNTIVSEVLGVEQKEVLGLRLRDTISGEESVLPVSGLFLGIGHIPNAGMFAGQIDLDNDGYIKTHDYVFTRVPGVFASGDVQDRRYRQAITAAGTGCMAALEVEKYLEEHGH